MIFPEFPEFPEFKGTKGERRVRYMTADGKDDGECDVFVEAVEPNNHIGKIEILMDDFGEQNGYPRDQKIADAKLDAAALELLTVLQKILKDNYENGWLYEIRPQHRDAAEVLINRILS